MASQFQQATASAVSFAAVWQSNCQASILAPQQQQQVDVQEQPLQTRQFRVQRPINVVHQFYFSREDSFEMCRLKDYAQGNRGLDSPAMRHRSIFSVSDPLPPNQLPPNQLPPNQLFRGNIFGSATPSAFFPVPFELSRVPDTPITAPRTAHNQQLNDERLAVQLQSQLWAEEVHRTIPNHSVDSVPPAQAFQVQRAASNADVEIMRRPARPNTLQVPMTHGHRTAIFGAPATAAVDLPPHVVPMIISEAVKQQQQCSITFDAITADNASVTTCGHVFTKDAIAEWMKQRTTCPECRKQCRIHGSPAAPAAPRPFDHGAGVFQTDTSHFWPVSGQRVALHGAVPTLNFL
jgi:hypothetical protein